MYKICKLLATHATLQCTCCALQAPEEIKHIIFECPVSAAIWTWIQLLLSTMSSSLQPVHITLLQVDDPIHLAIPRHLWRILQKVTCFCIWKARNNHFIPLPPTPWNHSGVVGQIWHRLKIYIKKDWCALLDKVDKCEDQSDWVATELACLYGANERVYSLLNHSITMPNALPT